MTFTGHGEVRTIRQLEHVGIHTTRLDSLQSKRVLDETGHRPALMGNCACEDEAKDLHVNDRTRGQPHVSQVWTDRREDLPDTCGLIGISVGHRSTKRRRLPRHAQELWQMRHTSERGISGSTRSVLVDTTLVFCQ